MSIRATPARVNGIRRGADHRNFATGAAPSRLVSSWKEMAMVTPWRHVRGAGQVLTARSLRGRRARVHGAGLITMRSVDRLNAGGRTAMIERLSEADRSALTTAPGTGRSRSRRPRVSHR